MWMSSRENGPHLELLAGGDVLEVDVSQVVLVELGAGHGDRQRAAEDGDVAAGVELAQHPRQRPEVILVAVGDDDGLDVVGALAQVGEVRQHEVDAEHVGRREPQPGVDDDDAVLVLDDRHVLADLAQAAEREDAERAHPVTCSLCSGRGEHAVAFQHRAHDRLLVRVELDVGSRGPPTGIPIMFSAALLLQASGAIAMSR